MKLQILASTGVVEHDIEIPNDAFQGLAKGRYWEIQYPLDDGPMPKWVRMRIGVDGQHTETNPLSQRQSYGAADTSPGEET